MFQELWSKGENSQSWSAAFCRPLSLCFPPQISSFVAWLFHLEVKLSSLLFLAHLPDASLKLDPREKENWDPVNQRGSGWPWRHQNAPIHTTLKMLGVHNQSSQEQCPILPHYPESSLAPSFTALHYLSLFLSHTCRKSRVEKEKEFKGNPAGMSECWKQSSSILLSILSLTPAGNINTSKWPC